MLWSTDYGSGEAKDQPGFFDYTVRTPAPILTTRDQRRAILKAQALSVTYVLLRLCEFSASEF
jgi:hypothetical protein